MLCQMCIGKEQGMKRGIVYGKRFCLLSVCFAAAMVCGMQIGQRLSPVSVVLMPNELPTSLTQAGSMAALLYAWVEPLWQTAMVLLLWYGISLVAVGQTAVSQVAFPLLAAGRGCLFGVCLSMVLPGQNGTGTVLGNALPGLVCYLAVSVLCMGFAAGAGSFGIGRTTGRFLTHAGAVFVITLCLGPA